MRTLRLSDVKKRASAPAEKPVEKTILQQATEDMAQHRAKTSRVEMHAQAVNGARGSLSLLHIFNVVQREYVRREADGSWTAVTIPNKATHKLRPTSWNTQPTPAMPNPSWALSVCAEPLRPEIKRTAITTRKPIPKHCPVYNPAASAETKRGMIRTLVLDTRASVQLLTIRKLSSKECDEVHSMIRRANLIFKVLNK